MVFGFICLVEYSLLDVNNKDIKDANNDDSDDEEANMDWWTKYYASLEKMIMVIFRKIIFHHFQFSFFYLLNPCLLGWRKVKKSIRFIKYTSVNLTYSSFDRSHTMQVVDPEI